MLVHPASPDIIAVLADTHIKSFSRDCPKACAQSALSDLLCSAIIQRDSAAVVIQHAWRGRGACKQHERPRTCASIDATPQGAVAGASSAQVSMLVSALPAVPVEQPVSRFSSLGRPHVWHHRVRREWFDPPPACKPPVAPTVACSSNRVWRHQQAAKQHQQHTAAAHSQHARQLLNPPQHALTQPTVPTPPERRMPCAWQQPALLSLQLRQASSSAAVPAPATVLVGGSALPPASSIASLPPRPPSQSLRSSDSSRQRGVSASRPAASAVAAAAAAPATQTQLAASSQQSVYHHQCGNHHQHHDHGHHLDHQQQQQQHLHSTSAPQVFVQCTPHLQVPPAAATRAPMPDAPRPPAPPHRLRVRVPKAEADVSARDVERILCGGFWQEGVNVPISRPNSCSTLAEQSGLSMYTQQAMREEERAADEALCMLSYEPPHLLTRCVWLTQSLKQTLSEKVLVPLNGGLESGSRGACSWLASALQSCKDSCGGMYKLAGGDEEQEGDLEEIENNSESVGASRHAQSGWQRGSEWGSGALRERLLGGEYGMGGWCYEQAPNDDGAYQRDSSVILPMWLHQAKGNASAAVDMPQLDRVASINRRRYRLSSSFSRAST